MKKQLIRKLNKKLESLKNNLRDQVFYLKCLLRQAAKATILATKYFALGVTLGMVSFMSATWHAAFIENKVGKNTVYIRSPEGAELQGSGTGFEIKAPSGKVYTLTNAHVCGLGLNGVIMVGEKLHSNRLVPRRIIEVYEDNDLCLVEGLDGYSGLEVASNNQVGDLVWSVGYPMGQGLNISSGRVKEFQNIDVVDPETPLTQCNGPNMKVQKFNLLFLELELCVITRHAAQTDVPTYPGDSGSPLVNIYGNVEGVIFSSDDETHWGSAVPLEDVNKFLKAY